MRLVAATLASAMVLAGCLAGTGPGDGPAPFVDPVTGAIDHDAVERAIGEPIEVFHDHNDVHLHTGSFHLDLVSWSPLGVELGQNGFANFVFWDGDGEELLFVAVDGDEDGGFLIVDASDSRDPQVLGRYWIAGNGIQEVRVTPDGRYAVMNVQALPSAPWLLQGSADCTVCLHVVDVQDRGDPRLVSVWPVEILGSHNMDFHIIDGDLYLFYVAQPLYVGGPLGNPPPGNHVAIARFIDTPAGPQIVKVSEWGDPQAATTSERSFPHDVLVQEHPRTGQKIAYVSHWQGGVILVDVSDPLLPRELSRHDDPAPGDVLDLHWVMQEEAVRGDGRVIAWSAPEIGASETTSGYVRAYDVTDPQSIMQVGVWSLPGDVTIPGRFIFTPHTTVPDVQRGLLAVSHYHAGVWVLDITEPERPRHLAYYLPHGDPEDPYTGPVWWKKPNFSPDGYGPNVYQARWKDDLLWVTDRGTGLYVLEYTGPVPGPVT